MEKKKEIKIEVKKEAKIEWFGYEQAQSKIKKGELVKEVKSIDGIKKYRF